MIPLETVVARMMELETNYYELQAKYQELIHQHEELIAFTSFSVEAYKHLLESRYEDECG